MSLLEEYGKKILRGENSLLYDQLIHFFTEDDWNYELLEERSTMIMNFKGKNGHYRLIAQAREEQRQIVIYSVMDVMAPEISRISLMEYITRVNWDLVIGNFEMDFSDGEIRFKTSADVDHIDTKTMQSVIGNLVYVNVMMMDRYAPGVMRVLWGGIEPAAAVTEIEELEKKSKEVSSDNS